MGKLTGQTALVTGAGSGIGKAIAIALARESAALVLVGRRLALLEACREAASAAGSPAVECCSLDLTDIEGAQAWAQNLADSRPIDVLVNNAGQFATGNAVSGDVQAWESAMNLNLVAPMMLTRVFSPGMVERERGTIVNIGSVAGTEGMSGVGVYAATKHGLRGWSLSCYQQLREFGVKVALINPAFVDTAMTAGVTVDHREHMLTAEDVAEAVMLTVNTGPACCPEEITLKLTRKA